MIRNLDMTTLRSFLAVADHGGVTRAAAALNLTQSAVSMQLKRLEEVMGIDLLDRSNRRIALTANGEQLISYARRIIQMNDEAVSRLTDQVYQGEIMLGVPHDIVYPVIPRVLQQFNAAYPRVNVKLQSSSTMRLHDGLRKGEVDLILTTEEGVEPGGTTLTKMPLRWAGARDGQAWKKRPLRLAFCRVCIFRPHALRHLERAGIDWEMAVDSEDDRAVEALVSADLAVGALLEDSIPPHLEAIPLNRGLPDLGTQNINMYGAERNQDEVIQRLADLLRCGFQSSCAPLTVVV